MTVSLVFFVALLFLKKEEEREKAEQEGDEYEAEVNMVRHGGLGARIVSDFREKVSLCYQLISNSLRTVGFFENYEGEAFRNDNRNHRMF